MRYQDWDVLIFAEGSTIPIQEFRTASFLVEEHSIQTPTLVTYVPSLPTGTPFVISLHSWTAPRFTPALSNRHNDHEGHAWGVKIIVDGVSVSSSTFTQQVSWPQMINLSDHMDAKGARKPLPFPPFHRSVLSRRDWHISDEQGRIRVVLTEGMRVRHEGKIKFQPINNIIACAFQPAPMSYLQKCNIAWPNSTMFANPWKPPADSRADFPSSGPSRPTSRWNPVQKQPHQHTTMIVPRSLSNMPAPPAPSQVPFSLSSTHPYPDMSALSSQSTSVASHDSLWLNTINPMDIGCPDSTALTANAGPAEVRLPSDQLRQIITALSDSRYKALNDHPMPTYNLSGTTSNTQPVVDNAARQVSFGHVGVDAYLTKSNRDRTTSDVTMHANCSSFPDCTFNDPVSGELIHRTPVKSSRLPDRHDTPFLDLPDIGISRKSVKVPVTNSGNSEIGVGLGKKRGRSPLLAVGQARQSATRSPEPKRKSSRTMHKDTGDSEDKENSFLTAF